MKIESSNFGGFVRFNPTKLLSPDKISDKLRHILALNFGEPTVDLLKNTAKGYQILVPFSRQAKDDETVYSYELWINTTMGTLVVFE